MRPLSPAIKTPSKAGLRTSSHVLLKTSRALKVPPVPVGINCRKVVLREEKNTATIKDEQTSPSQTPPPKKRGDFMYPYQRWLHAF
eukprot:4668805-Amphidinium_carterae.1